MLCSCRQRHVHEHCKESFNLPLNLNPIAENDDPFAVPPHIKIEQRYHLSQLRRRRRQHHVYTEHIRIYGLTGSWLCNGERHRRIYANVPWSKPAMKSLQLGGGMFVAVLLGVDVHQVRGHVAQRTVLLYIDQLYVVGVFLGWTILCIKSLYLAL